MAPDLKILAPQRERNITRDAAMEYAAKHGIEVPTSKKSPFSIDENLWGRSIEGGVLEDPMQEPPEAAFAWTRSIEDAPSTPAYLKIGFLAGLPVTVNGEKLAPAALIQKVSDIAGQNGVGRIDLMEDRVVGIKSRETYECPAAVVGRSSPHGLYNHALSTYGVGDRFDHRAAEGFIHLLGLQLQEFARQHGGIDK